MVWFKGRGDNGSHQGMGQRWCSSGEMMNMVVIRGVGEAVSHQRRGSHQGKGKDGCHQGRGEGNGPYGCQDVGHLGRGKYGGNQMRGRRWWPGSREGAIMIGIKGRGVGGGHQGSGRRQDRS